jgi:ABC-type multidrug transport system fused ATPase/permease subunit
MPDRFWRALIGRQRIRRGDRVTLNRYAHALSYLREWRGRMFIATTVTIVATALGLAQPLVAGRIVNNISSSSPVLLPALVLVAIFLTQSALDSVGRYLLERVGEQLVLAIRERFARHILALRIEHLSTVRVGDLLSQVSNDISLLSQIPKNLVEIGTGVLAVAVAAAVMCYLDPLLFVVALIVTTIAFGGASLALSRIQRAAKDKQMAVGELSSNLERAIAAIRTIRIFRSEAREEAAITSAAHKAYDAGIRSAGLTALATPIIRLSTSGSFLLILLIGSVRVANGSLQLGTLVTMFLFTMYALFPLSNLFQGVISIRMALGSFERVQATLALDAEEDPNVVLASQTPPHRQRHDSSAPTLEFDNVSFAYGDRTGVKDVSFTVGYRTTTAIVGPSGAGKTTLLSLIGKFYEPTTGMIRLGGRDYRRLTTREVRSAFAIVEQDAPVLHGTVRENLLIGNPEATEEQLWAALEAANLKDHVSQLQGGLDAPVGDRGGALSGGERQRIAVARALLSDCPIVLLDEPTSNLDMQNEKLLVDALAALRERKSLIIIAHRLSTVISADEIIVLADGSIEAQGPHSALVNSSDLYRSLVDSELKPSESVDMSGT